ncbi:MAG: aminotransferase class V-fold PLP-dependent enzyme [Nitrososphaeria archaeon]
MSLEEEVLRIREDFPILSRPNFIYLDNAATTQKPLSVIEKEASIYRELNANVHRGIYRVAEKITEEYESARKNVASFINAQPEEIVFTRNTTDSLNITAYALLQRLRPGDRIVTTLLEHHSNLLPWRRIAGIAGLRLELVGITKDGRIDEGDFEEKIKGAKVVSFTQVSNVAGTIVDVRRLAEKAKREGAIVVVDGAQAAPHMRIDVRELGVDFYAFSGHKMLGPTGIGVLYGRRELLEELEPPFTGGEMVKEVHREGQSWNELPWKFEPGTPNYVGAIALGEAVNYLRRIGMERIEAYERKLAEQLIERIGSIEGIRYAGPEGDRAALIAFEVKGIHPHDVAAYLDMKGIAVRSGWHCAQPLQEELGFESGTTRASLYFYNTMDEIEALRDALKELVRMA